MNKYLIIFIVGIFVTGILSISLVSDQFADANSRKKIHFTQTISSSQDPGQGHENHQILFILSPSEGTIYDGSLNFAASQPVQIVVLHEINENDVKGQPTWTIDGKKIYGFSLIDKGTQSDSFEFTGAALALHTDNSQEFTATISIDGWIRGQPTEIIMQPLEVEKKESSFILSKTNIPVQIPMHKGIFNSNSTFYIITDSSDKDLAEKITEKQGWKVELAPPLSNTPETALQKIFVFTNGVAGDGIYGYQPNVFSSTPSQLEYSPLSSVVEVEWKKGQNKTIFESAEEILKAKEGGRINFKETGIVINTPQIIWPEGQMTIRDDQPITDNSSYIGGQITEINEEEMSVTFIAHRGWGPDGRTIYYIVTDATPSGPAEMMGVPHTPINSELITSSAAVDLFQFQNGIKGTGPMGFQPGIASAALGDETYSPIWRIYNIEWNNPQNAKILETRFDIDSASDEDLLTVSIARPMNSDHLVNCPFIDPFQ